MHQCTMASDDDANLPEPRLLDAPPSYAFVPDGMRNPIGRPSKYRPEYCQIAVEMGLHGKTIAGLAAALTVSRECIYQWARDHEAFSDALSRMRELSQTWWEDHAQAHLTAKHYQAQLWRYSMAGRFKDDYGEQNKTVDVTVTLRDALADAKPVRAEVIEVKDSKAD